MKKKLLLISHNCLSRTGSNGRTLGNYLYGWDSECLAQLYIHPEAPDFSVCKNFFCISDSDIVRSILKRKQAGKIIDRTPENVNKSQKTTFNVTKKNSIIFLLREIAWNSPFWKRSTL